MAIRAMILAVVLMCGGVAWGQTTQAAKPAFLGALVKELKDAKEEMKAAGVEAPTVSGMVIVELPAGTPAEKSGLKKFDVIRGFDGKMFLGSEDYTQRILDHSPGDTVRATVFRPKEMKVNGHTSWEAKEISVTFGEKPIPIKKTSDELRAEGYTLAANLAEIDERYQKLKDAIPPDHGTVVLSSSGRQWEYAELRTKYIGATLRLSLCLPTGKAGAGSCPEMLAKMAGVAPETVKTAYVADLLSFLGAAGWELVQVEYSPSSIQTMEDHVYYFKRLKEGK